MAPQHDPRTLEGWFCRGEHTERTSGTLTPRDQETIIQTETDSIFFCFRHTSVTSENTAVTTQRQQQQLQLSAFFRAHARSMSGEKNRGPVKEKIIEKFSFALFPLSLFSSSSSSSSFLTESYEKQQDSEMGFDFSHWHEQFGQQVESRADRLAIAAASLFYYGLAQLRDRRVVSDRDICHDDMWMLKAVRVSPQLGNDLLVQTETPDRGPLRESGSDVSPSSPLVEKSTGSCGEAWYTGS
ncbi:hypothetical protein F2P81_006498 [Scophthalmus maximus]|uniref:Uncharacterized protein n=1 Tax=Scophthalmus maximus TaxID=52904 RepID=A0A6A4T9L5_SCOMX|nr:hypothetical protein F2P81_006498 [Scophthalmus maximus]